MIDPAPVQRAGKEPDPAQTAYLDQFDFLRAIAARKFGIPPPDDESVVHEVFVTYLRRRSQIVDERKWFIAAVCNASRAYWRSNCKHEALKTAADVTSSHADLVRFRVDASAVLSRLPARCRDVLRLRFYDGLTGPELAAHFRTTTRYAKLMLHRCMTAARALLHATR